MPRYDLQDDYDDEPGRQRSRPFVLVAIFGLALGLGITAATAGVLLYALRSAPPAAPAVAVPGPAVGAQKNTVPDEVPFRFLPPVMNPRAALGRPEVGPMPREVRLEH